MTVKYPGYRRVNLGEGTSVWIHDKFGLRVEVTQEDIDRGGRRKALSYAIARAAGVEHVVVMRGPQLAPSFETRIMASHMDEMTSYYVLWGGKSIRLPNRCQIFQSALEYGPGAHRLIVARSPKFTRRAVRPWAVIAAPFSFWLREIKAPPVNRNR